MTATEKYLKEKDELKSVRKNRILEASFKLFAEKGIDTIAMTDIAKKAEIGVASLYRYYETKDEIAIRTTIWAWEKLKFVFLPLINNQEYEALNGINQVAKICSIFTTLFETQNDFLRYIYFFDSYAIRTKIEQGRLRDYEVLISTVQDIVENAIKKGLNDGSINSKYKEQSSLLYFTLMHTIFSTAQKLTLSGNLLQMDNIISGKKQLEQLSEILINGLK